MTIVKCGARICHAEMPDNIGTLGCVVQSRGTPTVRYILTAAHVIGLAGYARKGDPILAFVPEEGRWVRVAEFERAVRLHDAPGATQVCDAAIARIVQDDLVSDEIVGIGIPQGIATGLWEGMRLEFHGAGSEAVIQAQVESTGNAVPVVYEDHLDGGTFTLQLNNQILYGRQGGGWATASSPGDSGALVLDRDRLAVGLHVGRTPETYAIHASVCTPLEVVLDALDVVLPSTIAPSAAPVVPSALPVAAVPPGPARGTPRRTMRSAPGHGRRSASACGRIWRRTTSLAACNGGCRPTAWKSPEPPPAPAANWSPCRASGRRSAIRSLPRPPGSGFRWS